MSINQRTTNTQTNTQKCIAGAQKLLRAGWLNTIKVEIYPQSTFTCEKEEIITLIDGSSNQVIDIPSEMDETRFANDASDNSVASFLSRPLKIAHFDWSTATEISQVINPWKLFLENKRVVNRIATFKLMRSKMKVKILINGNSFFFGRIMLAYWPLFSLDKMTESVIGSADLTQFSQMPRIFLDPTTSQGGEMTLPFFWHNDYIDLIGTDKDKLGVLSFNELSPLRHCNGDVSINTTVSITVYAWMEDVELQAPTAARATYIVPQSTGSITPYAKGSGMANSRDLVNQNLDYISPRGTSNMSVTDITDTTNKLTLTSNQEVSLDPRILGLSNLDEMNIRSIASKESWIDSVTWSTTSPAETLLSNYRVSPSLHRQATIAAAGPIPAHTALLFPACCGAVLPFQYWNGTFKLRLQIVASAFHRGRLAVVYDPHTTPTNREDNVQYTHIIDIATCRDVSFKVGPNQDRTMLSYLIPVPGSWNQDISTSALTTAGYGNGTISIYVINELTLPNNTATTPTSININCFVSVEDMDVFVPSSNFSSYTIAPQSTGMDLMPTSEDGVDESSPYNNQALSLDQPLPVSSKRHLVFGGENIESFRTMLNRYYPWAAIRLPTITLSGNLKFTQFNHRIFPAYRGNVSGAVHLAAGPVATNFFQMTLLNYLTPAFSGWRGSVRYKMFPRCTTVPRGVAFVSHQVDALYSVVLRDILASPTVATDSSVARGGMFSGPYLSKSKGTVVAVKPVNPSIEYEIPWWEPMRFCPGKVVNWTSGVGADRDVPSSGVSVCIDNVNSAADCLYDVHVAAGNDFMLYFFTGWPRMMYYVDAPSL